MIWWALLALWGLGFVICGCALWSNQVAVLRGRGMSREQINAYMGTLSWLILAFSLCSWLTLIAVAWMEIDERA